MHIAWLWSHCYKHLRYCWSPYDASRLFSGFIEPWGLNYWFHVNKQQNIKDPCRFQHPVHELSSKSDVFTMAIFIACLVRLFGFGDVICLCNYSLQMYLVENCIKKHFYDI